MFKCKHHLTFINSSLISQTPKVIYIAIRDVTITGLTMNHDKIPDG